MDNLSFFQLIWITTALIIAIYYITKQNKRGARPAPPHETTKPNENAQTQTNKNKTKKIIFKNQ
jgi:hypothetical protein